MGKKIKIIIVIGMIFGFMFCDKVMASSEILTRQKIEIDGEMVYKIYINGSDQKTSGHAAKVRLKLNDKELIGYCVETGVEVEVGTIDEQISLLEYFKNVLDESSAKRLVDKITLYTKYGYGSAGKETDKYYLATQTLIWEEISATGFYQSEFYEKRAGKKYDFDSIEWTIGLGEIKKVDLTNEKEQIRKSVSAHYAVPSFCSSQNTLELEVGESIEYTDNNNVLTEYEVSCDSGIICEKNGNILKVTTTEVTGSHRIVFNKNVQGSESFIYRHSGGQGVVINEGKLEPVSCEFGVDSYKNVQTSDSKILYVITIGIFCGVLAYIVFYTKKSLDGLK